jgi:hypothetical protein
MSGKEHAMTNRQLILLLAAGVVVLAASSTASAQQWGRDRFPRDGVCFFKDPNFNGEYFCAASGDSFSAVPDGMNDKISSIRVFGRAEVTVFQDVRFSGRSVRFGGDVRNLKEEGWNDRISSMRVRGGGSSGSYGSYGRPSEDPDRVIRRAYQDILNRDPDSQGMRTYRRHMIDDGWSEAEVRESLRKSPEFREKSVMTPARAQDVVRRAYLNVLKREPDSGSQGYVDRVIRDHWSQQDVERELRKSDEYRNGRKRG